MANKGVLSKNYYIDPEEVSRFGAEVYNMMAEADQAMAEASEIIAEIASLTERIPSQIRSNELLEACALAQAEIKSVDFLSYGQKVDQGLQNLLDHNQYITEHFIKNMETHTEKMRGLGEEFRRLTDTITYSGESMPLKGIAFSEISNVENVNIGDNAGESVSVREELLREVAARLSGANLGAYGISTVNSADDGEKATAYYQYLEELDTLDREKLLWEVAARLSGASLGAYGIPTVNSADDGEKATVYYRYLDKYANASISEIASDLDSAFETIEYTDAVDLVQIATLNSFEYNWMKSPYVTYEFMNKVIQVADRLGTSPDNLMTVMAVESELNPQCGNSSSPVGLIQFTDTSISSINQNNGTNYSKEDILSMDGIQQLDLVYLHCEGQGDLSDLGDLYMSIFCPKAVGQDDDFELYSEERNPNQYEQNKILDSNNDGIITRREVMDKVYEKRVKYE